MEQLQLLGIALGLATLSGLNLYLTVFATGLAVQQHWVTLAPQYQSLDILAHPAVLIVSGALYLLQFFADKIPWVDSLWDAIHTLIRPVGGAFLAVRVLGSPDPVYDVIIALLAGGVTLVAHGAKSGVRLVANHSPEPFSNIALSVAEDVTIIGGLALIAHDPVLAFIVFAVALALLCYLGPKIFRALKVNLWLLWRKLVSPAEDQADVELNAQLPADRHILFHAKNLLGEKIAWAVPCVSTAARRIPGNVFGHLVATVEDGSRLWFVGKRGWRKVAEELDLTTYKVVHEPKFLSENVVLYSLERKPKYVFVFDRSRSALVKKVVAATQLRLAEAAQFAAVEQTSVAAAAPASEP
jgi:hypothetical protein